MQTLFSSYDLIRYILIEYLMLVEYGLNKFFDNLERKRRYKKMFQGVRVPISLLNVLIGALLPILGTILIMLSVSYVNMQKEMAQYDARLNGMEKNQTMIISILLKEHEGK